MYIGMNSYEVKNETQVLKPLLDVAQMLADVIRRQQHQPEITVNDNEEGECT